TDLGLGPDPARLEEFNLRRAGGLGLARVRISWQTTHLRLGITGGAGVAYRVMFLERKTTAKDNPSAKDGFISDTPSYVAPVIQIEPTIMYRLSKGTAISLGFQMLFETSSSFLNDRDTPKTQPDRKHALGGIRSLTTPSYELASGVQMYMGPVL